MPTSSRQSRAVTAARHPTVSVLMPVGGRRSTTSSALESLSRQTFADLEILVIGHADVEALVAELPREPRVRAIVRSAPGIVGALNTGLAAARGRYVARMDDDDIASPERLEVQLRHLLEDSRRALVGARVRLIDAAGGREGIAGGNRRYERWLNSLTACGEIRAAAFVENPMPHPTWFGERALFERLGGWRDGDFPEDHDFVLRAWLDRQRMCKPEPVLLDWRDHPERLTRTDERYRRAAFIDLKARIACDPCSGLGIGAKPQQDATVPRGVWVAGVGRSARRWCDGLVKHGATVHGFVDLARPGRRLQKRHRPVIDYAQLLGLRGESLVIGAVTQPAAREAFRVWCEAAGLVAERDFLLGD